MSDEQNFLQTMCEGLPETKQRKLKGAYYAGCNAGMKLDEELPDDALTILREGESEEMQRWITGTYYAGCNAGMELKEFKSKIDRREGNVVYLKQQKTA